MRTRDKISRELKEAAPTLGVTVARSTIRDLQPFRDAAGQGTVVTRMGYKARDAAAEMTQLFVELMTDKLRFLETNKVENEVEEQGDERTTVAK
jgi:chromosome partitioning protein